MLHSKNNSEIIKNQKITLKYSKFLSLTLFKTDDFKCLRLWDSAS